MIFHDNKGISHSLPVATFFVEQMNPFISFTLRSHLGRLCIAHFPPFAGRSPVIHIPPDGNWGNDGGPAMLSMISHVFKKKYIHLDMCCWFFFPPNTWPCLLATANFLQGTCNCLVFLLTTAPHNLHDCHMCCFKLKPNIRLEKWIDVYTCVNRKYILKTSNRSILEMAYICIYT